MKIMIKNAAGPREKSDGVRIMVDETLPRGLDEYKAQIDMWPKEIGPSQRLRSIQSDPNKWDEFHEAYCKELDEEKTLWVDMILEKARTGTVTLLYSNGTLERNNAVCVRDYILSSREEFLAKAA